MIHTSMAWRKPGRVLDLDFRHRKFFVGNVLRLGQFSLFGPMKSAARKEEEFESCPREVLELALKRRSIRLEKPLLGKYVRLALGWNVTLNTFLRMRVEDMVRWDDVRSFGRTLREDIASGRLSVEDLRLRALHILKWELQELLCIEGAFWLKDQTAAGFHVRHVRSREGKLFFILDAEQLRLVAIHKPADFNRTRACRGARRKAYLLRKAIQREEEYELF